MPIIAAEMLTDPKRRNGIEANPAADTPCRALEAANPGGSRTPEPPILISVNLQRPVAVNPNATPLVVAATVFAVHRHICVVVGSLVAAFTGAQITAIPSAISPENGLSCLVFDPVLISHL
ncbi:MAG: hypothetical protein JO007_13270 [Alphaproteobacteria bacterium]|nr:hypothetical protein [Alphaproteobacteria bacterium]